MTIWRASESRQKQDESKNVGSRGQALRISNDKEFANQI